MTKRSTEFAGATDNIRSKKKRYNDNEFVNYDLSESERSACKAWVDADSQLDDFVLKVVDEGYKLSMKFDEYSSSYAAFVNASAETTDNVGLVLSGRGSTPMKALKQALFLHFAVFEGVWPRSTSRSQLEWDD